MNRSSSSLKIKFSLLAVAFSFFIFGAILEGLIRVSLFTEVWKSSPLRRIELYRNFSQVDFWNLFFRVNYFGYRDSKYKGLGETPNDLLGWSQVPSTSANPLGLRKDTLSALASAQEKILFYGDSFVVGSAGAENSIPLLMNKKLSDVSVVDLGVGGFGTDQSLLMLERTLDAKNVKRIYFGVLLQDMQRALVPTWAFQKPLLMARDQDLVVTNLPIRSMVDYRADKRPDASIYLWDLAVHYLSNHSSSLQMYLERHTELIALNALIFEKVNRLAIARGVDLVFVLFYEPEQIQKTDWKETWVKSFFDSKQIRYLDTKSLFIERLKNGAALDQFYNLEDRHHILLGNEIISQALVELSKAN